MDKRKGRDRIMCGCSGLSELGHNEGIKKRKTKGIEAIIFI